MTLSIRKIGTGKPVVMFHGWGFDHQVWAPWLSHLTQEVRWQRYQFYLVDLPGFGQSPYLAWSEFKTTLLAQLPEKFVLIGWSMGGLMATRLSLEATERVTRLLNVASSPRFISAPDWIGVESHLFDSFYQRFLHDPERTRQYFIRTQLQGKSLPSTLLAMKASEQGLTQGLDLLKTWDLRADLCKIRIPVTYIWGRLDVLIPYQLLQLMQQQYPAFDYMLISKAAHMPFISHPHEFTACLEML